MARETLDAQHEFSLRASSPRTEMEVKMAKVQLYVNTVFTTRKNQWSMTLAPSKPVEGGSTRHEVASRNLLSNPVGENPT